MVAWGAVGTALATAAKSGTGQAIFSGLGNGLTNKFFGSTSNSAKAAAQQYQYNLALQKQAQEWNEYMYKHRYQFQRNDMESAGINPLFGMGQAPSVTSGMNSVGMADMVGEQNNKMQQILQALDLGQNLSARRAQTKLLENQAKTEEINTNLKTIEVMEKNIETDMKKLQLKHLPQRIKAEIKEHLSNSYKNMKSAQKDISDVNTSTLNNKRTERIEEWHRKHPKLSGLFTGLGEGGQALMGLAIGGGSVAVAKNAQKKASSARKVRR